MTPFLLEHRNPAGDNFYTTRRGSTLAVVVHVTAGLQGLPTGADRSAEDTARYASTVADRQVSWHSGSDRDSFLQLLPDSYTAFQCHGYNSRTVGHEISKRDTTWGDESPLWVDPTLHEAAACLAPRTKALGIPIRHATKAELDHAIATDGPPVGFVSHADLDPTRRRDPGKDFPWGKFLALFAAPPTDRILRLGFRGPDVRNVQHGLNLLGNHLVEDGIWKPADAQITRIFRDHRGLPVLDTFDLDCWAAIRKDIARMARQLTA
jgi:hypothetical protein